MFRLINQYQSEVYDALRTVSESSVALAVQALMRVNQRGGTIFALCPPEDGGIVNLFVQDLAQGIGAGPFSFRLVQLYGTPRQILAWQNDWAYEDIYAEQMRGVIHAGDLVIAVARRGDALNIVRALQAARRSGATSIAIVGGDGGLLKDEADICLHVHARREEQIADVQVVLEHLLCVTLRRLLSQVHEARLSAEMTPRV